MASLGDIIFWSMIALIVAFSTIIILFLALIFSNSTSQSFVESRDRFPVGNLAGDVLLSCHLTVVAATEQQVVGDMAVTWTKMGSSGDVYKYKDSSPHLDDQNPEFEGRTDMFSDDLARGNGSLMLTGVRNSDAGDYNCKISASTGSGNINIHLRTAAFTSPTFSVKGGNLTARVSRWLPEPEVTWMTFNGSILHGITQLSIRSGGIYSVVSTLPVSVNTFYTFKVRNPIVTATSSVTITDSGVEEKTRFFFSAGPSLFSSNLLVLLSSLLISIGSP